MPTNEIVKESSSSIEELTALREKAIPRGVFQVTPCIVKEAKGATLIDVEGNEWIDFSGGIGSMNAGHCHDSVVAAVKAQAERFIHPCFHVSMYEPYIRLADKLNQITPGSFEKKTMFANSGAEAVENAVKIAKHYTNRPGVLCFEDAFHGRTSMGMSLTSKVMPYKSGFGPFLPEVYRVPFPYAYRMADGDEKKANQMALDAIHQAFKTMVDPKSIAAVIFEPVLGEGGFIPGNVEFFKELRELTQSHGILTICDEIQTGFGRTGTLYASENFDIDYDIILSAKSLASGMPLSAVTGKSDILDHPQVGGLGGTYGGNPLACAAALATIELFETTDLLEQGRYTGQIVKDAFENFAQQFSFVGDVRGVGAMMGVELVKDRTTKTPNPEATKQISAYCSSKHLSIVTAGTSGNVIRILAPLNINESLLRKGLSIMEEAFQSV